MSQAASPPLIMEVIHSEGLPFRQTDSALAVARLPVELVLLTTTGETMATSAAPLNGANRFAHIDAMRAFAVMLVVVAHSGYGEIVPGGSGVTIFFSISGFIITYLLLRERDQTGGFSATGFYFRRVLKIMPPLVVLVIVPTLVYAIWSRISWADFLAQVFFLFNWTLAFGREAEVLPGTAVVWSLSIEEQFYIVFALVWLLAVRSKYWRPIIVVMAAAGVLYSTFARIALANNSELSERIYYGSDTRLDGIALGVLAAIGIHLWQARQGSSDTVTRVLGRDAVLVGAVMLYLISLIIRDEWFRDTFRYSFQSIAACLVIIYGLLPGAGPIRRIFYMVSQLRAVSLVGLASYSIYLAHLVLIIPIKEFIDLPLPLEAVVLVVVGVGAGVTVYKLVETPVHRYGRSLREASQHAAVPTR